MQPVTSSFNCLTSLYNTSSFVSLFEDVLGLPLMPSMVIIRGKSCQLSLHRDFFLFGTPRGFRWMHNQKEHFGEQERKGTIGKQRTVGVCVYLIPGVCCSVVLHVWQVPICPALSESEWLWCHSFHLHTAGGDSKTHCPHGNPKT